MFHLILTVLWQGQKQLCLHLNKISHTTPLETSQIFDTLLMWIKKLSNFDKKNHLGFCFIWVGNCSNSSLLYICHNVIKRSKGKQSISINKNMEWWPTISLYHFVSLQVNILEIYYKSVNSRSKSHIHVAFR